MKSFPQISIVIPSYNKVRFIGDTLSSIFNQKYPNLEIIIQDGGSSDGTVEVIDKYMGKYASQIKFESKKDKGQLDAIIKGMKKARGEILGYINADDVYEKGAFYSMAEAYVKNPDADWFAGRGIIINQDGKKIARFASFYKRFLLSLNSRFYLLITNYLMQPSVFFTREAYRKYGPFIGTKDFIMEYDFWLKLSRVKMPTVIGRTLSKFRIEPGTKTMRGFSVLLREDRKIVGRYTKNPAILFLHDLHSLARVVLYT